jgi:hypothetical protein
LSPEEFWVEDSDHASKYSWRLLAFGIRTRFENVREVILNAGFGRYNNGIDLISVNIGQLTAGLGGGE